MGKFNYQANDASGKTVNGTIQAEDKQTVFLILKQKGLYPLEINKQQEMKFSFSLNFRRKISSKELLFFVMQLTTMIRAGMSLIFSINVILKQVKNKNFQKVIEDVKADVSKGKSLSEACLKYPDVFPALFSNIVHAGEESGKLELVLERYTVFMKNNAKINSEIKSAMAYPLILVVLSVAVMIFLTTFIVPQFADILNSAGTELPGTTKALLGFSAFMKENYPYVLGGIVLTIFGLIRYIKTKSGSFYFDIFKIKVPIFGPLIFKTTISRFIRTMGTLLASGVPFLKNLKLAINVINNQAITKKFDSMYDNISMGKRIAEEFMNTNIFSPIDIQMITIGENSGNIAKMFDEIADMYDKDIDTAVKRLTTSLEPIVLIVVASGIGFIAVSLVSAVMKAVSSFGK